MVYKSSSIAPSGSSGGITPPSQGGLSGVTSGSFAASFTATNPMTSIYAITFTVATRVITLAPMNAANSVNAGNFIFIKNTGSTNSFEIRNNGGVTLVSALQPGVSAILEVTSNATAAGTFSTYLTVGGTNGQLLYNNNGIMDGVPGSSINSGSGNIALNSEINFQNANNINGVGSLSFSGSSANQINNITDIFFDANGGGIHDFGDSTMVPGAVFDMNSGFIVGAGEINTIFNSLDDGAGNAVITGQISSGSVSTGVINGSAIGGTTVSTSGDIASSGGNIAGGYRMNTVAQGANYLAIASDSFISMDASTGARTITLPLIGNAGPGKTYWIDKTDLTANTVTLLRSGSNTINGGTSYVITQPNQYVMLVAVNSNWQVISAGLGSFQSPVIASVSLAAQGADIGSTNFTNANVAGLYRISYSLLDTTADLTAGTVSITIAYTDGAGSNTTGATLSLTGTGRTSGTVFVQLASGSISYSTSHTGIYGTAKYALYMTVERLL